MKTLKQINKTIADAWREIAYVLNNIGWHNYGDAYLRENMEEERGHRGICSGRNDYALTIAESARLFAVRQIAELLNGGALPDLKSYVHSRKSIYTAAGLFLKYGDQLREALKGFDLTELSALDYAELVKKAA